MTPDRRTPSLPSSSTPVYQLETAMGSAIECFPNAAAVVVPRSRFSPVKTCSDLFALRSEAYNLTADFRVELAGAEEPLDKLQVPQNKHQDKK